MTPVALAALSTALLATVTYPELLEPHMTRDRLPNRREADTIDIVHVTPNGDEQHLTISVGRQPDGRVAEVFIEVPYQQRKFATALLGKDVATLISIALQHGATIDELSSAMGRSDMNRLGRITEVPHTLIGTVLDALAASETP